MNAVEKITPQFTIEKGRPLPKIDPTFGGKRGANSGRARVYPVDHLGVGDCLTVPVAGGRTLLKMASLVSACSRNYGKKTGKKFATRTFPEEQVVRVWRTA